ncbi:MAG: DMT family transporter [Parvularcula sp.]|jgi:drug/metabolite transporter (DMT)-like permease|nr:DMT family transporter [Parvularcula sp.]
MSRPPIAPPKEPNRADWALWALVAVLGGSAPAAINFAIAGAPPAVIAGVRIWAAAAILVVYVYATGRKIVSPLSKEGRAVWVYAAAAGFCGYALPFQLFPLAQLEVTSITAGIMMAFLPVLAVLAAWAFAGEPLTRKSFTGVVIGTVGVFILTGPAALAGAGGTLKGIGLLLIAICGYAGMGVVMRRAPEHPARSFAAAMMIAAAVMSTPFTLLEGFDGVTKQGWLAIAYLGLGPTGFTSIAIVTVVRRAGSSFLSTSAYVAPVVAMLLGIAFFAEPLMLNQILGLATILGGIALTQNAWVRFQKKIWPRIVVTAFPNKKTRSPVKTEDASPPRAEI